MIKIGQKAPNFTAPTTKGDIDLYEYLGDSWGIITSHPAAFTPVCLTENAALANSTKELETRNVKALSLSVDDVATNTDWLEDIKEIGFVDTVDFPIISDDSREVSKLYGMLDEGAENNDTVRAVYFISPEKIVKAVMYYPKSLGRDFKEIFRVIDALQFSEESGLATPVNWVKGNAGVVPPGKEVDNPTVINSYLAFKDV